MSNELKVDPAVLEKLTKVFEDVSTVVEAIDPQGPGSIVADLSGSDIAHACAATDGELGQALSNVAKRIGQMAYLLRGAKRDYIATDEEIATAVQSMGDLP